jgi:hypothetical protein
MRMNISFNQQFRQIQIAAVTLRPEVLIAIGRDGIRGEVCSRKENKTLTRKRLFSYYDKNGIEGELAYMGYGE